MTNQTAQTSLVADSIHNERPVAGSLNQDVSADLRVGRLSGRVRSGSTAVGRVTDAPGWLFLGILVYAPWAYGCTRPWTIDLLNVLVFTVLGLWLAGCALNRTWPAVHPVLFVPALLLLLQGWWMTLNAGFSYDAAFRPHPRVNWSAALPGAVDYAVARPAMIGLSGMLGMVCLACDLGRHRRWRKRLWLAMALTGVSIILLGLAQKVTHAPGIFWQQENHAPTFFGPYRYHANAGAYINLVWPLVAAFLVHSIRRGDSVRAKVFWAGCFVFSVAGAMANTSRASGLIAAIMLAIWAGWLGWGFYRHRTAGSDASTGIGVLLLLLTIVLMVVALGGLDTTLRRWRSVEQEFTLSNSRLMGAQVCLQMLPQSGWLGFGPGTFRTAFPFFNKDTSEATSGVWLFAHQDYLQILVEWGWVGAALWAAILPGIVAVTVWRELRGPREGSSDRLFLMATVASVGSVLVHAWGDFPLQIASIQIAAATFSGLLWSQPSWSRGESGNRTLPRKRSRRSRATEAAMAA